MPTVYERPEGVNDSEWKELMEEVERHEFALAARRCPDCGAPLTKTFEDDDEEDEGAWGMWFNYECTSATCEFNLCQREGN